MRFLLLHRMRRRCGRGRRCSAHTSSLGFTTPLGSIFHLGMRVALVCMPEPGRSFLLTAYKRNPFATAATKSFPDVEIAFGTTGILWTLKCGPSSCANTMGKRFVVPKSAVLEHKPATGLTKSTPSFALVSMATYPSGCVEVAHEPEILFMRDKIWIRGVHIRFWWI